MLNATHFIEVYSPKEEYKHFEGASNPVQGFCLPIRYLVGDLEYTEKCDVFYTVAIFKIKVKK